MTGAFSSRSGGEDWSASTEVPDGAALDAPPLARLLAPVGVDAFFRDYWESQPLWLTGRDPSIYAPLLPIVDLNTAFGLACMGDAGYFKVPKIVDGQVVYWPPDGPPDVGWFRDAVAHGHSFYLNALHRNWEPARHLCAGLERQLHHSVGAMLWYTPPRSQGFPAHYDDHDVFVLQIAGRKDWRVYGPLIDLPLVGREPIEPEIKASLGEPRHEMTLEAGDLLYLPRGFYHEAAASDVVSVHITIGIVTLNWFDLLIETLKAGAARELDFRRALPPGFRDLDPGLLTARLRQLVRRIDPGADCDAAARGILNGAPAGHTTGPVQPDPDTVTLDTILVRSSGRFHATVSEQEAAIVWDGNMVTGPPFLAAVFRFIAAQTEFAIGTLPGLADDAAKVTLARQLIAEGILHPKREAIERTSHDPTR